MSKTVYLSLGSNLGERERNLHEAVELLGSAGLRVLRRSPVYETEPQDIRDLCAGFQAAVLESTADRLSVGLRLFHEQFGPPRALVAAGGVAANQAIRKVLHRLAFEAGTVLVAPPLELCTDNGAMIAWAGAERLALGLTDTLDFAPRARWPLEEVAGVGAKALGRG